MRLKKFLQNINILNIILISAVIAFAAYSIFPALEMKVKYALPAAKNIDEIAGEKTGELEIPSLTQYTAVVDENLFHPERRIPPEKTVEQPLPKPEFVLYGTMLSDDLSLAYLEDLKAPRNTPGRGKRQVALKKGDSLSGFVLKEIETDKITMVRGEEKLIVAMNDPQKAKAREVAAAATVAAAQPKAAPAATPAQTRREARGTASANKAVPGTSTPQFNRALEPMTDSPPPPTARPAPAAASPPPSGTPRRSSGGLGDYADKLFKR
jgi:hypothetical protein